jgi:protein phosphatase
MDAETPTDTMWRYCGATLKNTRGYENQDAFGLNETTYVVADGVSCSRNPAAAAQGAVSVALATVPAGNGLEWASAVIEVGDRRAHEVNGQTTITGLRFLTSDSNGATMVVFQVGDSMLLRVRDGVVDRMTEMHSLVEGLVKCGQITRAQAKRHPRSNVVTSVLGYLHDKQVRRIHVPPTDVLVLCTDGVHGLLDSADILRCLSMEDPARALCEAGQAAGSSDDATAIVLFRPRYVSRPTVG